MYFGTKSLMGTPMNLGDYNKKRGWDMPADVKPETIGYMVEYLDGGEPNTEFSQHYVSWSPKGVFEKSYKEDGKFDFGIAKKLVDIGKLLARKGWNEKNKFIFQRPEAELSVEAVVNHVVSLPLALKEYFEVKYAGDYKKASDNSPFTIEFASYLCLKTPDDKIINGWMPSQEDMQKEDWYIVE
jgi:hypothetical protein